MKDISDHTQATAVGFLSDLPAWESKLIDHLRLWMESAEGQSCVWTEYSRCFGGTSAKAELKQFEMLVRTICEHARRPLYRRAPGCQRYGSDEAIFATLVREASGGDLAEAAQLAGLMVPAGHAERIALMSAYVGQATQKIAHHSLNQPKPRSTARARYLH